MRSARSNRWARGSRAWLHRLLALQGLSRCADAAVMLTLAHLVVFELERGATAGAVARTTLVACVPPLVTGPVAALLADRWPRRRLLAIAHLARALLVLGALGALRASAAGPSYVLAALLLAAGATSVAARAAALPRLVECSQLVGANAATSLTSKVAGAIGVGIAALAGRGNAAVLLGVAAVAELGTAAGFATFPVELGGGRLERAARRRARPRRVASLGGTRSIVGSALFHRALYGAVFAAAVLLGGRRYGVDASGHAAALAVAGGGAFVGTSAAPVLARRIRQRHLCGSVSLLSAGAVWAAAVHVSAPTVLTALAVAAFAFQVVRLVGEAAIQAQVTGGCLGRAVSAFDMAIVASFLVGVLVVTVAAPDRPAPVLGAVALLHLLWSMSHVRRPSASIASVADRVELVELAR